MDNWKQAGTSVFLIIVNFHGGYSEPLNQNEGEPELFERELVDQHEVEPELFESEQDDRNRREPEYVPKFLELFG